MKKKILVTIISVLISVIALSGCGVAASPADPKPAEETEETEEKDTDDAKKEKKKSKKKKNKDNEWVSLKDDDVSEEELKDVEGRLNSVDYYGFLHTDFTDPRDICWDEVFYVGAGFDQGNPSEEIAKAFLKATGQDEIYTDITTLNGEDVRNYVKLTTGYDYSEMRDPLTYVYLKDYDLFLHEHGDTNQSNVTVTAVHKEGSEYVVTYEGYKGEYVVTFDDANDYYRFISNVPAESSAGIVGLEDVGRDYEDNGMIIPDSDMRELTERDLEGLDVSELRIARNEIYARHGRKFSDPALQEHFDRMDWYEPLYDASEFNEKALNDYEIHNLDLITKYEKSLR